MEAIAVEDFRLLNECDLCHAHHAVRLYEGQKLCLWCYVSFRECAPKGSEPGEPLSDA